MLISPNVRRGTCLALRFQTGSWMLFIDSRNLTKRMPVISTPSGPCTFGPLYVRPPACSPPYTFGPLATYMNILYKNICIKLFFTIFNIANDNTVRLYIFVIYTSQLARNQKRAYLRFSCRLFCAYLKPC